MQLYRSQLLELESHLSAVGREHSMSPQSQSSASHLDTLVGELRYMYTANCFYPEVCIRSVFYVMRSHVLGVYGL